MMYTLPNRSHWQGRKTNPDLGIQYWYQAIEFLNINDIGTIANKNKPDIAILGYACDEGVRRNFGRLGAKKGPDATRERLAKVAFHLDTKKIVDVGNIVCVNENMESCQNEFAETITKLLNKSIFPIAIGGGHDIAYGHFKGIWNAVNNTPKNKIGIINFDAHFDLRSIETQPNSGTPFNQILSQYANETDYFAIGIQQQANTKELFDIAKKYRVDYILHDACELTDLPNAYSKLSSFVTTHDWIYITIDLDGFSSAYAPGVSAPSPLGFSPSFVCKVLAYLLKTKKVIACDIAELNPEFDKDNTTATLAARLVDFIAKNRYVKLTK